MRGPTIGQQICRPECCSKAIGPPFDRSAGSPDICLDTPETVRELNGEKKTNQKI